ncbi:hypothetical protein PV327_004201 [Microctonus hyperodae]|uniref:Uncharacterized protein n=1 Tax=Microctonus hyperodae TaxID=165561 RepID=A0AA39FC67_MICHY|nr:hypothetical protein PV327_004201 [Microctonus hyperodae]
MASTVSISRTIYFILVQLIILNIVNCEFLSSYQNATDYESSGQQDRSRRSLFDTMPNKLQLHIKNPMGKPVVLKLRKVESYLANKYLPVVTQGLEANTNIMNDVGEFVVYHDSSKFSAVVYFEKLKTFRGVIGTDYFIQNLPFDFDSEGNHRLNPVGDPFIIKYEHTFKHIFPDLPDNEEIQKYSIVPSVSTPNQGLKRPSDSDPGPSSKHQRSKRTQNNKAESNASNNDIDHIRKRRNSNPKGLYLEILIFITQDIARIFENHFGENEYIQWIIRYYIVYFNAVDMIFRKLHISYRSFYINIAKIVIENNLQPFNFIHHGESRFTGTYEKLPEYLQAHNNYYPPDSFDLIFISTTRLTTNPSSTVHGQTKHGENIYEARKNNNFYGAIPISIVEYYYTDYLLAVHEIAKTFKIEISPPDNERTSEGQCYGIMQIEGPKCDNCLKWRPEDHEQFETFFRENSNRCFLLNKPRSIHPPGPYEMISRDRQCRCFGYTHNPWKKKSKCVHKCSQPLTCYIKNIEDSKIDVQTILPIDGTPCNQKRVCWNQQCVPLKI